LFAPTKLLIVRLGSMGDILHTLPAVTTLRRSYPQAMIGWIVEERWAELLCTVRTPRFGVRSAGRPLVDRVHTVDTKAWRRALFSPQTWERMASGLSELRAGRYEVAIDFQGAVRSALLARWSGAQVIYGSAQPRENVASMFYTRQTIVRGAHVVEQNISLAESVTCSALSVPEIEFPLDDETEHPRPRRLNEPGDRDFVLLNPGAGWGAKQWPAERFAVVAKALAHDGLRCLVNAGPGEEPLANAVELASNGAAKRISCSLTELITITRHAQLFIGGDTGPMHLAAAVHVPVVAIFGPTNPARNGPYGTRSVVLRSPGSVTTHSRSSRPDPGLLTISTNDVITAARQLLRAGRGL